MEEGVEVIGERGRKRGRRGRERDTVDAEAAEVTLYTPTHEGVIAHGESEYHSCRAREVE